MNPHHCAARFVAAFTSEESAVRSGSLDLNYFTTGCRTVPLALASNRWSSLDSCRASKSSDVAQISPMAMSTLMRTR